MDFGDAWFSIATEAPLLAWFFSGNNVLVRSTLFVSKFGNSFLRLDRVALIDAASAHTLSDEFSGSCVKYLREIQAKKLWTLLFDERRTVLFDKRKARRDLVLIQSDYHIHSDQNINASLFLNVLAIQSINVKDFAKF